MRIFFSLIFVFSVAYFPVQIFGKYEPYIFREWTKSDGLWDSFTTNVNVSACGNVVVNQGNVRNFSILDGFNVNYKPKPNWHGYRNNSTIIENPTNEFWTPYFDTEKQIGGISHLIDNQWVEYPIATINQSNSTWRCFYPIDNNSVLTIDQTNLLSNTLNPFSQVSLQFSEPVQIGLFIYIQRLSDNRLIITGGQGFIIIEIPSIEQQTVRVIYHANWQDITPGWQIKSFYLQDQHFGAGIINNDDSNLKQVFVFEDDEFTVVGQGNEGLKNAWPGPYKSVWEHHGIQNLYVRQNKNSLANRLEQLGVLEGEFKDITVHQNTFWIATSNGVIQCSPNLWQLPSGHSAGEYLPTTVYEDHDQQMWLTFKDSILKIGGENASLEFPQSENVFKYSSPFSLKNHSVIFNSFRHYSNLLTYSILNAEFTVLTHPTKEAMYYCDDYDDSSVFVVSGYETTGKDLIERYDGENWEVIASLPGHLSQVDIRVLRLDRKGNIWMGTWGNDGLYKYANGQWETIDYNPDVEDKVILSLLELDDGTLLAGGRNNLYQYDGQQWLILESNIENIRSLALGIHDCVWVASQNGVYRYEKGSWIHYTTEDGLPSNYVNQVYVQSNGKVWACTQRGAVFFDDSDDQEPPDTMIDYNETASAAIQNEIAVIHHYGIGKWKKTTNDRLLFSYRMDRGEWSPFSNRGYNTFQDLSVGVHEYEIRSMDLCWNIDPSPATFRLEILPIPIQQQPWFPITSIIIFLTLILLVLSTVFAWRRVARQAGELERQVINRTIDLQQAYQQLKEDSELRKQLEDQLRQSSKLEAIGTLAGGIAHDFNNVLTGIMGFASLIKETPEKTNNVAKMAENILVASQKVSVITKQLLAFSRKQFLNPTEVNLNDILHQMSPLIRKVIQEHIEIQSRCDSELGLIYIDSTQFEQIIINLAVNARDAMPNGGNLIFETSNVIIDETYAQNHAEAKPGHYVVFSVSDNGTGISKNDIDQIFDPFFTTKEVGKGTGMGLATVHGIVKQSGGFIYVYSEAGQGTTFKLYFPRITNHIDNTAKKENPPEIDEEIACNVLFVEDEENIRTFVSQLLKKWGCKVQSAENGEDALRKFQELDFTLDLLITDLIMPKIGGQELYHILKSKNPDLKVLFISGYSNHSVDQNGYLESSATMLQKPFMPNDLKSAIHSIISL